jgi:hypothetical protein
MTLLVRKSQPASYVPANEGNDEWTTRRVTKAVSIEYDYDIVLKLPPTTEDNLLNAKLNRILDTIHKSRKILDLENDWDDDGSPGYKQSTWKRATDFLLKNTSTLSKKCSICADAPRVLPGPDGSIDLHWQVNKHDLLINIPADENQLATYYGDNNEGCIVKGTLDTSASNQWLMMWLTE